MTKKTDANYGRGEATIRSEEETLSPFLQQIRLQVKETISKENFEIPLLPHVATQVLQMANNPRAGIPEIENLVKQDQVIAAKIIKMANSPFYRGVSTIVSLRDAMGRIGLKALKDVVFSLSVHGKIFQIKGFEQLLAQIWDHSVACAAISQTIAKKIGADTEQAFLTGLLHDIGKPVLVQVLSQVEDAERKKEADKMKKLFKPFDAKAFKIPQLHEVLLPIVFQEYHAVVGALVAGKWKLPEAIVEVTRFHHDYTKSKDARKMTTIVSLANMMCHHFGYGHDEAPVILHQQKGFTELGISAENIKKIEDEVPIAVKSLVGSL